MMKLKAFSPVGKSVLISLALLISIMAFLSHSYAAEAPKRVDVLIGFTKQPGPSEQALVRSHSGSIKYTYHLVPAIAANIPEAAIAGLKRNPNVTHIDLDGKVYKTDTAAEELSRVWGVTRVGSGDVHGRGYTGTSIKVAVIDTGIDYNHPDFKSADNATTVYKGGKNFVSTRRDAMDDEGHGTHVAGTIAAMYNGTGIVGVAPNVELYALKVLDRTGSGSWSNVIAAIQWAVDNGMQVTNNSYGSAGDPGLTVKQAFDKAEVAGIVNVASAGNSGNTAGSGDNIGYPARYDSVIAVAATDSSNVRGYFSSTGAKAELAAPGVSINSTKLGGGYIVYNGTSMASPHVAGATALILSTGKITDSNGNNRINDEVRQLLRDTATDLGPTGWDTGYGYGLINVAEAVTRLIPAVPPAPPSPAVNVSLSSDKSSYTSGSDTAATLTAVVNDEYKNPIEGLESLAFQAEVNGVTSSEVTFTAAGATGTYTANLDISNLETGSYPVSVTVTDSRGVSGTSSITITIASSSTPPPAPVATNVIVDSIRYSTEGGGKHLLVTVKLLNNLNDPVASASVSIELYRKDSSGKTVATYKGTGTTGTNGEVSFKVVNAPPGYYTTKVMSVTTQAPVLTWDGVTPDNGYTKG